MTGNGISEHNIKESIAALHIQRRHKIDKADRCTACEAWPWTKQLHFFTHSQLPKPVLRISTC